MSLIVTHHDEKSDQENQIPQLSFCESQTLNLEVPLEFDPCQIPRFTYEDTKA